MSNQYEVLGKAPVAEDLKKLSADRVFERMLELLF